MSYGSYNEYTSSLYMPVSAPRYVPQSDSYGSSSSTPHGSSVSYGTARQLSYVPGATGTHTGSPYSSSPRSHASQYLGSGATASPSSSAILIPHHYDSTSASGYHQHQYGASSVPHQYHRTSNIAHSPYTGSKSNTSFCSDTSAHGLYDRAGATGSTYGSSPGSSLLSVYSPGIGSTYSSRSSSSTSLHSLGHSLHHEVLSTYLSTHA